MDSKDDNKKKESANSAETKKQNPSDVDKEDVQKSSKNNQSGKTDNIK